MSKLASVIKDMSDAFERRKRNFVIAPIETNLGSNPFPILKLISLRKSKFSQKIDKNGDERKIAILLESVAEECILNPTLTMILTLRHNSIITQIKIWG